MKTVLFVDGELNASLIRRRLEHMGCPGVRIICIDTMAMHDSESIERKAEMFAAMIEKDEYDVLVIGNNDGKGLEFANVVPTNLKCKTIIVWYDLLPGDEERYKNVGFTSFMSRDELPTYLLGLFTQATA